MCALGGQALTDHSPRDLVEVAGLEGASLLCIFYAPFSPSHSLSSFLPSFQQGSPHLRVMVPSQSLTSSLSFCICTMGMRPEHPPTRLLG